MILLSIHIPTTPDRDDSFARLEAEIRNQCVAIGQEPIETWPQIGLNPGGWRSKHVEFLYCKDNKEISIGAKRDILYKASTGLYSVQIDSDDMVAPDYVKKVLDATATEPDCITYQERVIIDGKQFRCNHSIGYRGWHDNYGEWDFIRSPYMKDVIRTSIAKSVPVPDLRWNEDEQWSILIAPFLKTEKHINEELYWYQHESSEFKNRYGIIE